MKRIGITFSHRAWPDDEDNRKRIRFYMNAVEAAGAEAEPLWLPDDGDPDGEAAERAARDFDGMLVSGGADLPPSFYGEEIMPNASVSIINLERPAWEAALLKRFLERGKPALGICYGCQFFNVWRGGSLLQDIPTQWTEPIVHAPGASGHGNIRHTVRILPDTHLHRVIGEEEIEVVSSHHQAIARLAEGAQTSAFAPDRLAESVEFSDAPFFLGVQWHPERDPENPATQRLFAAFVAACG